MSAEDSEGIRYGHGTVVPLQEPGKAKTDAKSLIAVLFLPVLSKILSLNTIDGLKNEAQSYIVQNRTAY